MIEEVFPRIFRIEVPLPGNPLKTVNAYLVKGGERSLLIDTAFNLDECRDPLEASLIELRIPTESLDFFVTHAHPDHIGLVPVLFRPGATAYMGEPDVALNLHERTESYWMRLGEYMLSHGFPRSELSVLISRNPAFKGRGLASVPYVGVSDGSTIAVGGFRFECVAVPGHTPGQTCLYERGNKLLFAGDHILEGISPHIVEWMDHDDSLGQYLDSLRKIAELDVALVLPGHRGAFTRCRERIVELELHHRERLRETVEALERDKNGSAYGIASRMRWGRTADAWNRFPPLQRWFATGETLAHLEHQRLRGIVRRESVDGVIQYFT